MQSFFFWLYTVTSRVLWQAAGIACYYANSHDCELFDSVYPNNPVEPSRVDTRARVHGRLISITVNIQGQETLIIVTNYALI